MQKRIIPLFFLFLHLLNGTTCSTGQHRTLEYTNNYDVVSIVPDSKIITVVAEYTGLESFYKNPLNPMIRQIKAEIFLQSDQELRVRIRDSETPRWEIPESDPYPHDKETHYIYDKLSAVYKVEIDSHPFSFRVIRTSTKEVIFSTQNFNFIYSDRYLEFASTIPTEDIFGIGERVFKMKLKIPGGYTIWNRDLPATLDDGESGALNTYGLYPLYLSREKSGHFHMVYLRNSNGMDVFLNNTIFKDRNGHFHESKTITYKVTGGIIDLKFFLGGRQKSPEEVVKMYHSYIGGYTLQAFWSFGFHQCRWGYQNLSDLNRTLANYHNYGMPLDTIWIDIDYMEDYAIFTIDDTRFNSTILNRMLEDYQKKLVLIIDPGVKVKPGYVPYDVGMEKGIFIKNYKGDPLLSCVWPGQTHFPDFMDQKTQDYWGDMFEILHNKVNFSGIWLDMNELSNFVDGEVGPGECGLSEPEGPETKAKKLQEIVEFLSKYIQNETNKTLLEAYDFTLNTLKFEYKTAPAQEKCGYSPADYFYVYNPGDSKLDQKTLCLNGQHHDGNVEYNLHNFNGFFEALNTFNYLKTRQNQQQPFILSRSTAPGSGKFTTHWTGDNVSTFKWMKLSIAGLMNFNIFGIPNVGADICGFASNTTEELCSRWMQLGAFYPFSRNHNTLGAIDQDPFAFGDTLIETSMKSLKLRYSILKYYYSLFVRNHGKGTVMRPLFFEFPEEKQNYDEEILDREFLIGKNLLVTPVLDQGIIHIKPYFPGKKTVWYNVHSGRGFKGGRKHYITNKLNETAPVFLRSGGIIFRQNVDNVTSTYDLNNVYYLSVALKKHKWGRMVAKGEIMACEDYHNYEKLEKCLNGDCSLKVKFSLKSKHKKLVLKIKFDAEKNSAHDVVFLSGVELYGAENMLKTDSMKTIVIKSDVLNAREIVESKVGFVRINGRIVKLDFGMEIGVHPNETIIIRF